MEYIEKNEKMNQAIIYATNHHRGQLRKGSVKPAIIHSLETMMILDHMEADMDLLIAGVLHDTVEDTNATIAEIQELFGVRIAKLVGEHTEDKTKSWQERKANAIEQLKTASTEVKMLILADKISNMRDILADYHRIGDRVWNHFSGNKEKQAWYYHGILEQLYDLRYNENTELYYWEMVEIFQELFVVFYLDRKNKRIYRYCADKRCDFLQQGDYCWQPLHDFNAAIFAEMEEIERVLAEQTEDIWDCIETQ